MATISSILVVLFLFSSSLNYVSSEENCTLYDTLYYIVNKVTGKVLADGDRNRTVGLYDFDDSIYESYYNNFQFYPAPRTGLWTIHIKSYMGALGVDRETNTLYMSDDTDSIYQEWFFNADGTIVNGGMYNYGVKVDRGDGFPPKDVAYLGPMDTVAVEDLWEFVVSPWQVGT